MAKGTMPQGPTPLRKNLAVGMPLQQAQDKAMGKGANKPPPAQKR